MAQNPFNIKITPAEALVALDGLKSDTVDLDVPVRTIYVGGAGNIVLQDLQGNQVTFTAPPVGSQLNVCAKRILTTGTTATNLIGYL